MKKGNLTFNKVIKKRKNVLRKKRRKQHIINRINNLRNRK
jgi:hypothetical protein